MTFILEITNQKIRELEIKAIKERNDKLKSQLIEQIKDLKIFFENCLQAK